MSAKTKHEFSSPSSKAKISLSDEEFKAHLCPDPEKGNPGAYLVYQYQTRRDGDHEYNVPYPAHATGEGAGIQVYDAEAYGRMVEGGFESLGVKHEVLFDPTAYEAEAKKKAKADGSTQ